jgi:hypothetical protein
MVWLGIWVENEGGRLLGGWICSDGCGDGRMRKIVSLAF